MKREDYIKKHNEAVKKGSRCTILAVHRGDEWHKPRKDADGDQLHMSFTVLAWKNTEGWERVVDLDEGLKVAPKEEVADDTPKRGRKPQNRD